MTTKDRVWRNIPNMLTVLRMLLIPVFLCMMNHNKRYAALAVFVVASVTDLADGFIARKHKLISDFGKLMDPLADKLMVLSLMLSLVMHDMAPVSAIIVLLVKEVLMLLGGFVLLKHDVVVYSHTIGKVAQFALVLALVSCFFPQLGQLFGIAIPTLLVWVAVGLSVCALFYYASINILPLLTKRKGT